MKRFGVFFALVSVALFASSMTAGAAKPAATTFVAVLNASEEVPHCDAATNAARGVAVFHVNDESVDFKIVANNLPGVITAAHIHVAPTGVAGMIVQPLPVTPGAENGVIARGTFVNPTLVSAIQTNGDNYYVNVHSTACLPGVIRGQLADHGPLKG